MDLEADVDVDVDEHEDEDEDEERGAWQFWHRLNDCLACRTD